MRTGTQLGDTTEEENPNGASQQTPPAGLYSTLLYWPLVVGHWFAYDIIQLETLEDVNGFHLFSEAKQEKTEAELIPNSNHSRVNAQINQPLTLQVRLYQQLYI